MLVPILAWGCGGASSSASAVAPPQGAGPPAGTVRELAPAEAGAIVDALRAARPVAHTIEASAVLQLPGGARTAYVLWQYDRAELCGLVPDDDDPSADEECPGAILRHPDTELVAHRCASQGLARVRLEDGGPRIDATVELEGGCILEEAERFELSDPDADGRWELSVLTRVRDPGWETHSSEARDADRVTRVAEVFRDDLQPQIEPVRSTEGGLRYEIGRRPTIVRGLRLRDVDGDGHPDALVTESVDGHPQGEEVRFYDAGADRWGPEGIEPSPEMRQRIERALNARYGEDVAEEQPAQIDRLVLARVDGETLAFVLYAVGESMGCAHVSGEAERARCEAELGDVECDVVRRLARVRLPDGDRQAAHVDADLGLRTLCELDAELRFRLVDLDWDGRLELLLDVTTVESTTSLGAWGFGHRLVVAYDSSLRAQMPVIVSSFPVNLVQETDVREAVARSVRFEDVDGDHHPDVAVEARRWAIDELGACDRGAGEGVRPPARDRECPGSVERSVLVYDPSADRWAVAQPRPHQDP